MKRAITFAMAASFVPFACAGTVITTNLPAGDAIVNVDATNDGAAFYSNSQSNWYEPFSINGSFLEYTVQPGTYSFTLVDPSAAANLFPSLSASQLSQVYTSWTFNSPWATDWMAWDKSAETDTTQSITQLFSGAVTRDVSGATGWNGLGYSSSQEAYDASLLGGYYNQIVTGPGGRFFGTTQSTYTFASAETLVFAIPDYYLPDNGGGVSILVAPQAVPEPSSLLVLAPGLLALARRRSVRK